MAPSLAVVGPGHRLGSYVPKTQTIMPPGPMALAYRSLVDAQAPQNIAEGRRRDDIKGQLPPKEGRA